MDEAEEEIARKRRAERSRKRRADDEEVDAIVVNAVRSTISAVAAFVAANEAEAEDAPVDHRHRVRGERKLFRHDEALHCIHRDYLGIPGDGHGDAPTVPLFDGKEFDAMFRISRSRFQRLMEDFGATGDPFYVDQPVDMFGRIGASMEARLMLPLKCLAYGVPPHCFRDYFQMSKTLARTACQKFNRTVTAIYKAEYLRQPTAADVKAVLELHRKKHNMNGMLGSLDCMHTNWKNCPVAWQGSFKGAKKQPTIVLEGACDHHMWFWHASYGHAGTLNDVNIMNISPLQRSWVDGSFTDVEAASGVVPFTIADTELTKTFVLVDGIYPRYSRFVKAIAAPITLPERKLTKWQESTRKDVERAFGLLQMRFQCTGRPIHLMNMDMIAEMMSCCLVLHNMCVSDRVMEGDVRARYNPTNTYETDDCQVDNPADAVPMGDGDAPGVIGIHNAQPSVQQLLTRRQRWEELQSLEAYNVLLTAMLDHFG